MLELAQRDERVVFLTGDLGFMALEALRDGMGKRFINAGVAEQNMVSMAAGLAAKGFRPWVYSITPFVTLRPYEQLRNDVCLHKLPVRVVGNGGGYGYGIMGATHHALEDIGALSLLPHMRVLVPTYADDVPTLVETAQNQDGPVYLRLAKAVPGACPDENARWRKVTSGDRAVILTTGPVLGGLLNLLPRFPENSFEIYSVTDFPIAEVPAPVVERIRATGRLLTLEEHLPTGGLGASVAHALLGKLTGPLRFQSLCANGYPSGRYGSQAWHLEENGLAGPPLHATLEGFLRSDEPLVG